MENTSAKMTRRKKRRKRKSNRRSFLLLLIQLIVCIAIITTAFVIYSNNKKVQPVLDIQLNQENNNVLQVPENKINDDTDDVRKEENTENASEVEKNRFDGLTMVNDNIGVPIICYHSVREDETQKGPIVIPKDIFREQLKTINENGYITLTMSELNDYLFKDKPIPQKSVVITFDDGYRDNYTNAFPILKEFNMKATIFIISSYINKDLYLTEKQIKEMNDYGIDIESHTVSHKRLSTFSYNDQLRELKDSKEVIEKLTQKPVVSVAYPEGIYNNDTKKAVIEAGYSMGFTIEKGYADRKDNLAQINRICIDYTYKPNNIINALKNLKKWYEQKEKNITKCSFKIDKM